MILYKNLKLLKVCGWLIDLSVELVDSTLVCRVDFPPDNGLGTNPFLFGYIKLLYNGQTGEFRDDGDGYTTRFPWAEGVKTMTLRCSAKVDSQKIFYNGLAYGSSYTFSWLGPAAEEPVCTFTPGSIHEDYSNRLTWSFSAPHCAAVELWYYERGSAEEEYTATRLISGKYTANVLLHPLPAGSMGKECYYRLVYCGYPTAGGDLEPFLTCGEVTTPVYTIGLTQKYPAVPPWITYNRPSPGGNVHISWGEAVDEFNVITSYTVEHQVDGGGWSMIYSGASTSFAERIPADFSGASIAYRVCSVDSEGDASDWRYGAAAEVARSNLFVSVNGTLRPAAQVMIGGTPLTGGVVHVG